MLKAHLILHDLLMFIIHKDLPAFKAVQQLVFLLINIYIYIYYKQFLPGKRVQDESHH